MTHHYSSKKQWTTDEEQDMLSSIQKGELFEKIAQRHDRTSNAIKLRFGMICKKEMETTSKTLSDLSREYRINEQQVVKCINDLETIQKKNQITTTGQTQQQHISSFDLADISIIKEEILVINEKLDKIHKYIKKLLETNKNKSITHPPKKNKTI